MGVKFSIMKNSESAESSGEQKLSSASPKDKKTGDSNIDDHHDDKKRKLDDANQESSMCGVEKSPPSPIDQQKDDSQKEDLRVEKKPKFDEENKESLMPRVEKSPPPSPIDEQKDDSQKKDPRVENSPKFDEESLMPHSKREEITEIFMNALESNYVPYVAAFWDMENCKIPTEKSGFDFVNRIREIYFANNLDAGFNVVCNTKKEREDLIDELLLANIEVFYAESGGAGEITKGLITQFFSFVPIPATLILIAGDMTFCRLLKDARYVHQMRTVLVHPELVDPALKCMAEETMPMIEITDQLPDKIV